MAMFSAVDAVLIRPLLYVDAGRLVMIWDNSSRTGFSKHFSTPAEWHEWRRSNTVFTDMAATDPGQVTLSGGEPEELRPQSYWKSVDSPGRTASALELPRSGLVQVSHRLDGSIRSPTKKRQKAILDGRKTRHLPTFPGDRAHSFEQIARFKSNPHGSGPLKLKHSLCIPHPGPEDYPRIARPALGIFLGWFQRN
jgi:hypothetical protein